MKKLKNYIWLIVFVGILALAIITSNLAVAKDYITQITVNDYIDLYKSESKNYVYLGSTTCSYCEKIKPVLNKVIKDTDIKINYINLAEVTQAEYDSLVETDEFLQSDWGTPTLMIVQNGEIVDTHVGYAEYEVIKSFLLEEETPDYTESFNPIDVDQYLALYNGSNKSYIYIGSSTCYYCDKTNPVLSKLVEDTGIVINYIDLASIDNDNYNRLVESNESFQDDFSTPTLLIVKDGKILEKQVGYAEYEVLSEFFKK